MERAVAGCPGHQQSAPFTRVLAGSPLSLVNGVPLYKSHLPSPKML